jgi:hypothetical protein
MAGINARNAGKALLTSLLLSGAIILDTSNALAQTVGENFSKKNLKKFEKSYDKKFKDDSKTIKA